jgi:hypothetical protein
MQCDWEKYEIRKKYSPDNLEERKLLERARKYNNINMNFG